ncbi:oligosaccharide flippase family protein [Psychrobacter sp.]|uniref:oligosaccharide flippase family protein n=1 Tax=Psychrobacter sp. TaxID=56811 RepID=UPI0025E94C56|nr:oligosaccharide flippase family protein [Psychrobacter sp.]
MSLLRKNVIYLIFVQGLNYLIPLIIFPYLARVLGTENYGLLSFANSIILYFCMIIDFGFTLSGTKKISILKKQGLEVDQVFWDIIFAKLMLLIVSISLMLSLAILNSKINNILYILLAFTPQLIATAIFPLWYFQGVENIKVILISQVAAKLSVLPTTFYFVKDEGDIVIAALIQSCTLLVAALLSWTSIIKDKSISLPNFRLLKNTLKELSDSTSYFIGSLAISIYTISTPLLLGFLSSEHEMGIYSAASKFTAALAGLFIVAGGAIFPRVNALLVIEESKAFSLLKTIFLSQTAILLIIAFFYVIFNTEIIDIFLGISYIDAVPLSTPLTIALIFSVISVILCNYVLVPMGHKKLYYIIPISVSILHLIYTPILIKYLGALGAAYGLAVSEIISFIILLICCIKYKYITKIFKHA